MLHSYCFTATASQLQLPVPRDNPRLQGLVQLGHLREVDYVLTKKGKKITFEMVLNFVVQLNSTVQQIHNTVQYTLENVKSKSCIVETSVDALHSNIEKVTGLVSLLPILEETLQI